VRRAEPDALRSALLAVLPGLLTELGYVPARVAAVTFDRAHLPPGYRSPGAFGGECRRLRLDPGTYRPGRSWSVPSDVWERARREDRQRRRKPAPEAVDDPIDGMLERSGLRLLRGSK